MGAASASASSLAPTIAPTLAPTLAPTIALVIHMIPEALAKHDRYRAWVRQLGGAAHAFLSADALPWALPTAPSADSGADGRRSPQVLAFHAAAVQRATLRVVAGERAFPTAATLAVEARDWASSRAGAAPSRADAAPSRADAAPSRACEGACGGAPELAELAALGWGPRQACTCSPRRPDISSQELAALGWGEEAVRGRPLMAWALGAARATLDVSRCVEAPDEDAIRADVEAILTGGGGSPQAHSDAFPTAALSPQAHSDALIEPPPQGTARPWARDRLLVCMLGTGCAVPSKHRAPAAIYLHAFSRGGVLLDAGEGSLGQLQALFGPEGARGALRGLSAIFISHHHADHHLGLMRLLEVLHELDLLDAAAEAGTRSTSDGGVTGEGGRACATPSMLPPPLPWRHPILIVGPRAVGAYLAAHTALLPPAERPRFHFETCAAFNAPRSVGRARLLGAQHGALGLAAVRCVPVVHCADAWGVVLSSHDGWTLVYSGDTRPCEALVAAGQGATILIHEATFDDDLVDDARAKRHSTRAEALDVARRMGAYRTILTHLSQRYTRERLVEAASIHEGGNGTTPKYSHGHSNGNGTTPSCLAKH
ncbi:zinc phosphodiesterase elac protein 2-like protein, partial [Chrysochromulina tobinii]